MVRQVITDAIWNELEKTLRKYGCHRWKNDRNIMEAILWKLRTGAPWRDVPQEFCRWKTAYNRFNRWASKGLWDSFFLSYGAKLIRNGYSRTEGYIRAHQHASGARRGEERAIGRSRGGLTSKIHVSADAHGNPIDFEITGGEVHDGQVAPNLIEKIKADYWIADKGYDSEEIRECARKKA